MATTTSDFPLTKKRKRWVKQFKPTVDMKGKPLALSAPIQERYADSLTSLVYQMTQQTKRDLIRHFKAEHVQEYFAQDASIATSSRVLVNNLKKKFEQLFNSRAEGLAERMLNATDKNSSHALHESLKELSGGLSLGTRVFTDRMEEVMKASLAENVSLIKSIPQKYFLEIQGEVMRSITTGKGIKDLVPFLSRQEGITVQRARLIAHDQYRKAYANINANRMQALGVDQYEWVASGGGQEPRPLHHHRDPAGLNGRICSLSNPPIIQYAKGKQPEIRGKPGDLINCTCIMRPIISFTDGKED